MASWYQAMSKEGAHFHYVSNSPLELWPVLRAFLALSGFPSGSCTLKEYGGATSALAKLWEEPGQRKRVNVEMILKEFPESQFLLVGDSGEQDLELYVSLAQQYPRNILAIYIRDVTTPFTPPRAPSASSSVSSKSSRPPAPPPEVSWGHSHSASDLASLVEEEQQRGRAEDERPAAPFSDMPDLPGQFDGSHERPVLPHRRSGSEATVTSSSTTASSKGAPPVPPRPALGGRAKSSPRGRGMGKSPSTSASSSRASSPTRASTLSIDTGDFLADNDEFADALSPNNPLRPSPPLSRAELGSQAAVEAFYRRVADAERTLPDGVVLRLFRHGNECGASAFSSPLSCLSLKC